MYIYIYKCKRLLLADNLQFYPTNWFKIFKEYFFRLQECFYILIIQKYYNNKKKKLISRFSSRKAERKNITSVFHDFRDLFSYLVIFFLFWLT